jgi:hypothetical protein
MINGQGITNLSGEVGMTRTLPINLSIAQSALIQDVKIG